MLVRIVTPSSAGRFFSPGSGLPRSPHHRAAAEGMQSKQPDPRQLRGRSYRSRNGVRDVVELQVEKYLEPEARELLNGSRAFRGE